MGRSPLRRRTGRVSAVQRVGVLNTSEKSRDQQRCAEARVRALPRVRGHGSAVKVAAVRPFVRQRISIQRHRGIGSGAHRRLRKSDARTLAAADRIAMSADDRSGLYERAPMPATKEKTRLRPERCATVEAGSGRRAAKAKDADRAPPVSIPIVSLPYLGSSNPGRPSPSRRATEARSAERLQPAGAPIPPTTRLAGLTTPWPASDSRASWPYGPRKSRHLSQSCLGLTGQRLTKKQQGKR